MVDKKIIRFLGCPKRNVCLTLKNFYKKIGISDTDEIRSKIDKTWEILKDETVGVYKVGRRILFGKKTPIAMIKDPNEKIPVMIHGKPYLRDVGDWVILIQTKTNAYLVLEHCNIYCPAGWSEEDEDFIIHNETYEMLQESRFKDVYDTLN